MTLTVGSLFSGIGGLDLGLERAGMKVIWQSEIDPYACKVLSKHWPEVVNHGDIKKINWEEIERPNVICGGYPCQPFSTAGKRRGEEDSRHLWPWVREAISRLRPDYAILENVRGHLSMGGLSVIGELASIGYDAEWRVVSAASVGANHRRDRIIIVAYPQSQYGNVGNNHTGVSAQSETLSELRNSGGTKNVAYPNNSGNGTSKCNFDRDRQAYEQGQGIVPQFGSCRCCQIMANTDSERLERSCRIQEPSKKHEGFDFQSPTNGRSSTLADDECERHGEHRVKGDARQKNSRWVYHGTREEGYVGWQWWESEPDVGRVAHGIPSRVDRLRGLGNAVVPQVAEVIGRLVMEHAS